LLHAIVSSSERRVPPKEFSYALERVPDLTEQKEKKQHNFDLHREQGHILRKPTETCPHPPTGTSECDITMSHFRTRALVSADAAVAFPAWPIVADQREYDDVSE